MLPAVLVPRDERCAGRGKIGPVPSLLLATMMTVLLGAAIVSSYFYGWRVATLYASLVQQVRLTREVRTGIRGYRTPTR